MAWSDEARFARHKSLGKSDMDKRKIPFEFEQYKRLFRQLRLLPKYFESRYGGQQAGLITFHETRNDDGTLATLGKPVLIITETVC